MSLNENESTNIFHDQPEYSLVGLKAWKSASRAARSMTKHSKIVNPVMEKQIPRLLCEEVVVGELLGSGGFNDVFALEAVNLVKLPLTSEHARKICSETQQLHRNFLSQNAHRGSSGERRYAIKLLSQETIDDPERFRTGAADLVIEAKFLASLDHPNIIKLRGMAAAGTSGFASCKAMGYFLILDGLMSTLADRLKEWKEQSLKLEHNYPLKLFDRGGKRDSAFLANRLHIAFNVACALRYLHENKIICEFSLSLYTNMSVNMKLQLTSLLLRVSFTDRDLKPENIGFDIHGDVKLFDFGLAKELDDNMKSGCSDFYEMSGNTGSLRYMAPEVALSEPYNLTADVYSFDLVLWHLCSLEVPYDGMNRCDHLTNVVKGSERPELNRSWSTQIKILMKRSWDPNPLLRPSMDVISEILKREISALRDGNEAGLEDVIPRSTNIFNSDCVAIPSHRLLSKQLSKITMNIRSIRPNFLGNLEVADQQPISVRQATAA